MSVKEVICILCPFGCKLEVNVKGDEVTEVKGNRCKEGIEYARHEVFSPERVLTTTMRTLNPEAPLLPVRSDKPLPKEKLEESMEVIAKHTVNYPIKLGEVIVSNILNTGVNIIASRSMSEKN